MNNKPKLVFAHDARFFSCNDDYYGINLSRNIWTERYLSCFSHVTVLARKGGTITTEETKRFVLASGNNIRFSLLPFENLLFGRILHRRKFNKIITNTLDDCDAVIVRLPSTVGIAVIERCKAKNKPYLIELVGCPWDTLYNLGFGGKLLAPYSYLTTKNAIKNASHVIYITEKFLQRRYPTKGKSAVCSNVILSDLNADGFARKRSLLNDKGPFVIGSCGSAGVKFKGQQFVIEAVSILRKRGIDVSYEIVGGGDQTFLRKVAKKFNVEPHVTFWGNKSGQDTKKWMERLQIYVQPSLSEGQGRSLIEAMRMGCACMCSRVGGMVELLDDKYIFDKANPTAIANCFELITKDMSSCVQSAYANSLKFQPKLINQNRMKFFREFIADTKRLNNI